MGALVWVIAVAGAVEWQKEKLAPCKDREVSNVAFSRAGRLVRGLGYDDRLQGLAYGCRCQPQHDAAVAFPFRDPPKLPPLLIVFAGPGVAINSLFVLAVEKGFAIVVLPHDGASDHTLPRDAVDAAGDLAEALMCRGDADPRRIYVIGVGADAPLAMAAGLYRRGVFTGFAAFAGETMANPHELLQGTVTLADRDRSKTLGRRPLGAFFCVANQADAEALRKRPTGARQVEIQARAGECTDNALAAYLDQAKKQYRTPRTWRWQSVGNAYRADFCNTHEPGGGGGAGGCDSRGVYHPGAL